MFVRLAKLMVIGTLAVACSGVVSADDSVYQQFLSSLRQNGVLIAQRGLERCGTDLLLVQFTVPPEFGRLAAALYRDRPVDGVAFLGVLHELNSSKTPVTVYMTNQGQTTTVGSGVTGAGATPECGGKRRNLVYDSFMIRVDSAFLQDPNISVTLEWHDGTTEKFHYDPANGAEFEKKMKQASTPPPASADEVMAAFHNGVQGQKPAAITYQNGPICSKGGTAIIMQTGIVLAQTLGFANQTDGSNPELMNEAMQLRNQSWFTIVAADTISHVNIEKVSLKVNGDQFEPTSVELVHDIKVSCKAIEQRFRFHVPGKFPSKGMIGLTVSYGSARTENFSIDLDGNRIQSVE
jgi:hypothetical protein